MSNVSRLSVLNWIPFTVSLTSAEKSCRLIDCQQKISYNISISFQAIAILISRVEVDDTLYLQLPLQRICLVQSLWEFFKGFISTCDGHPRTCLDAIGLFSTTIFFRLDIPI